MNRLKQSFGLMLLLGCFSSPLHADSMIELGLHIGGEELIQQAYENGERDSIKAGERFSFGLGRLFQLDNAWEVQLMFGVKSDAKFDKDQEVSWVRYPVNCQLFYRMQKARVGLGTTIHFSPKLSGSGVAANINEEFENAVGGLVELDFIRSEKFLWGIRLTVIDYESKKDARTLQGSSIGFLIIAQL